MNCADTYAEFFAKLQPHEDGKVPELASDDGIRTTISTFGDRLHSDDVFQREGSITVELGVDGIFDESCCVNIQHCFSSLPIKAF